MNIFIHAAAVNIDFFLFKDKLSLRLGDAQSVRVVLL